MREKSDKGQFAMKRKTKKEAWGDGDIESGT